MCDFLASVFSEEAAGNTAALLPVLLLLLEWLLSRLLLRLLRLLLGGGDSVGGGTHPGGGFSSTCSIQKMQANFIMRKGISVVHKNDFLKKRRDGIILGSIAGYGTSLLPR